MRRKDNIVDFIKLEQDSLRATGTPTFEHVGDRYHIKCPCGMEMISRNPRHICDKKYGGCGAYAIICQKKETIDELVRERPELVKAVGGKPECSIVYRFPNRASGDACPECIKFLNAIHDEKVKRGEINFDPREERLKRSVDSEKRIAAMQAQLDLLIKQKGKK